MSKKKNKPVDKICPECGKGILKKEYLGIRSILKCNVCGVGKFVKS